MTLSTLAEVQLRPPTLAEAETVVALMNRASVAGGGPEMFTVGEVVGEWQSDTFSLEDDARVAVGPDGQIIGYAELFFFGPDTSRIDIYTHVHPDYAEYDLDNRLLQWGESRAREFLPHFAPDTEIVLKTGHWSGAEAAKRIYKQEGFELVRHSWTMQIDFEQAPPAPEWPDGITVRNFVRDQDERIVYDLRQAAFADMWGFTSMPFERWVYHLISNEKDFDSNFWFLAFENGELVGHALCLPRTHEDPAMGWVQNLAVRRDQRKRGLGMALLLHSFGAFYGNGSQRAGLSVDATSLTGAQRLYQRAGMRSARQFDTYHKTLRPGQ
jgi:ribosomal protein S18 acetylase RimI-like enzyme